MLGRDRFTRPMFLRLWAPAMLSSFGWALSDMADAIVVGHSLGTVGLAAISLILPIYMVNNIFAHGIGLSGSVRYSRLLSEGETKKAKDNFSGMFILALILSISTAVLGTIFIEPLMQLLGTTRADGDLFNATRSYLSIQLLATPLYYLSTIFNYYLRNDGSEKRAGAGSLGGNICDIMFNVVFVMGPLQMGTGGAALATAIGQVITIAIYLPGFFSKKHILRFALPARGWIKNSFIMLFAGLASSVQYLYQMVFFLVCNNLLKSMSGETGIAVFDIIQNTSYLILYLYEGTSRAMQPVLSTYHGEKNEPGRKYLLRIGFAAGILVGSAMIITTAAWPGGLCMLFGIAGSEAEPIAHVALRIYSLGAFFAGISMLMCCYYQSYEREKMAFLIGTLRGAAILLPVTFMCTSFGLYGFWWLFPITEISSVLIVQTVIFIMIKRGKYNAKQIDEERVFRRTILSTSNDIGSASADLEAFCEKWEADMRQQYTVMMTVEELGMTILEHGFEGREDGYIQITVIAQENGDFELHLRDDARSFNPFSLKTARASSDEDVDMDSMGVLMIKKRSKEFHYRQYQGFNTLIVKI